MRRAGLGLKHLISLHLLLVLGGAVALVAVASARLTRHALVMERVDGARSLLRQAGEVLPALCPQHETRRDCPALVDWTRRQQAHWPDLREVSIFDQSGRLWASSNPKHRAMAMWDGLFGELGKQTEGEGWAVGDEAGGRVLWVEIQLDQPAWHLRARVDLRRVDARAGREAGYVGMYAALVGLVMLILGWLLFFRTLLRPMERLVAQSERISEGDLSFLVETEQGSELGRLGMSLGRMARRIEGDRARLTEQLQEQERLNRELTQAQQGLLRSEKLASVGRLAAGVAHEVGNPISAVLGYVDMLRRGVVPTEEQGEILARVEREIERVDGIIRDLLAYSRPGKKGKSLQAPMALAEEAVALLKPQPKFKTIVFKAELPEDLPLVFVDADAVRQVLVNLLFNALDAVEDGGTLWLRALVMGRLDGAFLYGADLDRGEPEWFSLGPTHRIQLPAKAKNLLDGQRIVVFSVVDDGAGISETDLPNIFDPFFTTKEPGKGTGLGLAICHAAVQSQGGEIWAYSRPGQGCQLAFCLPVPDDPAKA